MRNLKQGFTLIEVLISLTLFSFILFEFDGMQVATLRQASTNYFFSIAANELNAMYERLFALEGHQGLETQILRWQKQLKKELPQGTGKVQGVYPHYWLSINWGGDRDCKKTRLHFRGCVKQEAEFKDHK